MSLTTAAPADVLLIGCGYLGRRVAARFAEAGRSVAVLTRSPDKADEFRALGWRPVLGDLTDESLALPPAGLAVWSAAPDRGQSPDEIYVQGMTHALRAYAGPWVVVSSTGVYGQTDGDWVDETAATEPSDARGRAVLAMEQLVGERAVILRFAGLYGPGRWLRADALRTGQPLGGDPDSWLNLIHVEDGADAVAAAAQRGRPGSVYNVSDGKPVRRREFFQELAARLGTPPPTFAGPAMRGGNRRIDSRRIRADLGWSPRHPDYVAGLAEAA